MLRWLPTKQYCHYWHSPALLPLLALSSCVATTGTLKQCCHYCKALSSCVATTGTLKQCCDYWHSQAVLPLLAPSSSLATTGTPKQCCYYWHSRQCWNYCTALSKKFCHAVSRSHCLHETCTKEAKQNFRAGMYCSSETWRLSQVKISCPEHSLRFVDHYIGN